MVRQLENDTTNMSALRSKTPGYAYDPVKVRGDSKYWYVQVVVAER